jgi:hypothetical protein
MNIRSCEVTVTLFMLAKVGPSLFSDLLQLRAALHTLPCSCSQLSRLFRITRLAWKAANVSPGAGRGRGVVG